MDHTKIGTAYIFGFSLPRAFQWWSCNCRSPFDFWELIFRARELAVQSSSKSLARFFLFVFLQIINSNSVKFTQEPIQVGTYILQIQANDVVRLIARPSCQGQGWARVPRQPPAWPRSDRRVPVVPAQYPIAVLDLLRVPQHQDENYLDNGPAPIVRLLLVFITSNERTPKCVVTTIPSSWATP